MNEETLRNKVEKIRRFNRFYTKRIGLLENKLLKTSFPLTQARIIYELAHNDNFTANDLKNELGTDQGYISRILKNLEKDGLLRKFISEVDQRQKFLKLTNLGNEAFRELNERSIKENTSLLFNLSSEKQERLVNAMEEIESIFSKEKDSKEPYIIRLHKQGDIGWIIQAHGILYAEEYGWDETFEALCAGILAELIKNYNSKRERIWIAERYGEKIGTVTLADAGNQIAQLRLLIVEQKARGKGLGSKLVKECIDYARNNSYKKIKLWTQSNLLEARQLYKKAGFRLVKKEPHYSFGHDLVAEIWELELR